MADEIKVATEKFTLLGSNGSGTTQDLTITDLGWTPKAALFYSSASNSGSNPRGNFSLSSGGAALNNGTTLSEWTNGVFSQDGVTTTISRRDGMTDAVVFLMDGSSAVIAEYGVDSFISNGVRLSSNIAATSVDTEVTVVFFGGADLEVYADTISVASNDITAPGFTPTAVFMGNPNDDYAAAATPFGNTSLGFSTYQSSTVTQNSYNTSYADSISTTDVRAHLSNTKISGQKIQLSTGTNWLFDVNTFDANGFSTSSTASSGGDETGYLALNTGDRKVYTAIIDTPTSAASDWTVSSIGFQPQGLILFGTAAQSIGNLEATSEAGAQCFYATDGTRENGLYYHFESGVTTTNGNSGYVDNGLLLTDDAGTTTLDLTNLTFNSNGFTVSSSDITTANATATKMMVFAIEEESTGDISISATTDTLTISEQQATVQQDIDINISAGVDTLIITENQATVQQDIDISISATTDSLVISEQSATVQQDIDINISATTDSLAITEFQSVVSVGNDISISATTDTLTISEQQATIQQNIDINISASTDTLVITENQATIQQDIDINISAGLDTLTISEQSATVKQDVSISASSDTLNITENQSTVKQNVSISASTDSLTITEFGSTVFIGTIVLVYEHYEIDITEIKHTIDLSDNYSVDITEVKYTINL